jgi:hypothetical protein
LALSAAAPLACFCLLSFDFDFGDLSPMFFFGLFLYSVKCPLLKRRGRKFSFSRHRR